MSVINSIPLIAAGDDGYQISRSVRLRSSASAYLNRTPASAGNRKTWTWSGWVKRGKQGAINYIFGAPSSYSTAFRFNSANTFYFTGASGTQFNFETTAVYRDSSAWYHVVIALDTTQATSTNRVKIYINGNQVTAFASATYPSLNLDGEINNAHYHGIGTPSSSDTHDGYLTEINFIDGQALTPSSFGETNAITGVWQPKKYAGTYGTNGFYLNFSDNSTAAALGTDFSGNSNTWTVNNISVTAGVTYDSMLDVPTPFADGGNGRGNYCVLSPLITPATTTIVNGNLGLSGYTSFSSETGTIGVSSGKWYFEFVAQLNSMSGITGTPNGSNYPGQAANAYAWDSFGPNKYNNNTATSYGSATSAGDIVGVAFDLDSGSITFYKNNVSQGTAYTFTPSGTYFPVVRNGSATNTAVNFGQRPFSYTPPTGFVALNTQNLPAPTISNGGKHMNAITYTGTGASVSRTGVGFQPDLVWFKSRNVTENHQLFDSVRGVQKSLYSNLTNAETTDPGVYSFDSDGFTAYNSAYTYVAWNWNAGGSTVTNTSGSISAQVRANPTAGFSVVTYTGNATNGATVGHGLGVSPSMIIGKIRSTTGDWYVWQTAMGDNFMRLNTTAAQVGSTANGVYNTGSFSSTVFALGSGSSMNTSSGTYVAYCFAAVAGYSAFGGYTGNGSTDGPFVFTGFRPRFIVYKVASGTTGNWKMHDTSRGTYNDNSPELLAESSAVEGASSGLFDLLSNGFKLKTTSTNYNGSGNTYIYMAFAENPFKYSLAR